MTHHIVSVKTYLAVFVALLVLLAITVAVAFVDLGPWSNVAAMTVAVGKMLLISLYFMHLRYSSRLTMFFAGAGLLWLAILIAFTVSDYLTRGWFIPISPTLNNPYDPLGQ